MSLCYFGSGNSVLNRAQKAQQQTNTDQLHIKIKKNNKFENCAIWRKVYASQRALLGKWKRKLTEGMNIFANNISAKGLVSKTYFKTLTT